MKGDDKVDDEAWRFLLTGGVALDNPYPNPACDWMTDKAWSEIVRASNLKNLQGLYEHIQSNPLSWKAVYDSGTVA